jgi:hypothetical protein
VLPIPHASGLRIHCCDFSRQNIFCQARSLAPRFTFRDRSRGQTHGFATTINIKKPAIGGFFFIYYQASAQFKIQNLAFKIYL